MNTPHRANSRLSSYFLSSFILSFMIGWSLVLASWIYLYSIRQAGSPNWDEFERLAWATDIWRDIRHRDWFQFWRHTNSQVTWPFLHSWLTALLFLCFGATIAAARMLSLGAFLGSSILIAYTVTSQQSKNNWLGGVTAWGLFTLSPIVMENSTGIMSEMFGCFMTICLLTVVIQHYKTKKQIFIVFASIILSGLFFYKYNFAILTWVGLVLHRFALVKYSFRSMISKENGILFGPPILLLIAWFIPHYSFKIQYFWGFLLNNPEARMPMGWNYFLFYFRCIPNVYYPFLFFWYLSALVMGYSVFRSKELRLANPYMACFLIHFMAAVAHPMKMERFQFISMGLFYILTGESIGILFKSSKRVTRIIQSRIQYIEFVSILVLMVSMIQVQTVVYRKPHTRQGPTHIFPMQSLLDHIEKHDRIALLFSHDVICTPAFNYYYITHFDQPMYDSHTGTVNCGWLFLYQDTEAMAAIPYQRRIEMLRQQIKSFSSTKVVVLKSTNPELIGYFDTVYGGTHIIASLLPDLPELTLVHEQEFRSYHARLEIYQVDQHELNRAVPSLR